MSNGYEVNSMIEMADDHRVIRHGPVYDRRRDAEESAGTLTVAGVPSWVTPVSVTGPDRLNGEV